jgi:hypothetical protein
MSLEMSPREKKRFSETAIPREPFSGVLISLFLALNELNNVPLNDTYSNVPAYNH